MAANIQQQRIINEQLHRELDLTRIQASEACALIIKYVGEHEQDDCLLNGFISTQINPYHEKTLCMIL